MWQFRQIPGLLYVLTTHTSWEEYGDVGKAELLTQGAGIWREIPLTKSFVVGPSWEVTTTMFVVRTQRLAQSPMDLHMLSNKQIYVQKNGELVW